MPILYFRATAANCRLSLLSLRSVQELLCSQISAASNKCNQQSKLVIAFLHWCTFQKTFQHVKTAWQVSVFLLVFFCYFHAFRRPWWNMALFPLILLHWQRRIRSHCGKTPCLEIGINSSECMDTKSRVILLVVPVIQSWATRRSVMDYFPVIITKNAKQRRQAALNLRRLALAFGLFKVKTRSLL